MTAAAEQLDKRLVALRAASGLFHQAARGWMDPALHRVLADIAAQRGAAAWSDYGVVVASDYEDLNEATDYTATVNGSHTATVAFRGRRTNSHARGQLIRQMTLRRAGRPPRRTEEQKVLMDGFADYYVTVWCSDTLTDPDSMEAGIIVDLEALRALPPPTRQRMEHSALSNVPFVGFDAAALIAHDVVPECYPNEEYFDRFRIVTVIPGQEVLPV
jgi:hypothetical protein